MLPREKRLTRGHFLRTRDQKRSSGTYFSVAHTPSPLVRVAVVVSKKTLTKAVERNLLKRRVLSIIKSQEKQVSGEYVFYARKGAGQQTYQQLKEEILLLLKQTHSRT